MPAGAVADRDQAAKIEVVRGRLAAKRVRRRGDVPERAGIAAAGPVDPAIVDVPHRKPALGQIVGNPVHDRAIGDVGRPAAAMDHQHRRVRPLAGGEPQIGDLERIGAVGDRPRGDGAGAREQCGPGHDGWLGRGRGGDRCWRKRWRGHQRSAGREGGRGITDGKDEQTHQHSPQRPFSVAAADGDGKADLPIARRRLAAGINSLFADFVQASRSRPWGGFRVGGRPWRRQ